MMMTMTTLPLTTVKSNAPFALAFGAALFVSSALCVTVPVSDWTTLSVGSVTPGAQAHGETMGTSTGQPGTTLPVANIRTAPESISQLRALSGLTADQVGRLLGVSRRSVQNWVAGNAMAVQHQEQVSRLLSLIQGLPGSTADDRRGALLDSRDGQSLFHQLLAQRAEATKLQGRALSVGDRIAL